MKLEEGSELGAYRVVEQVGQGGMAVVYKAYQASLSRFVALKVLPAQLSADPEFRARFKDEGVRIAALRHPNILIVYDYGDVDGVTFIATEFVDGGTLDQQLGKPLPLGYVVEILQPVAGALDYAHARGVIHRDVKPSNILLTRDGRPLLSDFGLARMMTPDRDATQAGMIMGTPQYMAPEQSIGEPEPASDIYALGVVAYEMLTGRVPFTAPTPMAVILAHREDPLPMPRSVNPAISQETEAILLKALARKPSDRFQSGSVMVRALGEGETGGSERTRPMMTPSPRPAKETPIGLRRAMPALALALVVLLAISAAVAFVLFRKQGSTPTPAAATPHPATWHPFEHVPGILDIQPTSVTGKFLAEANGALLLVTPDGRLTPYSTGPGGFSSNPAAEAYVSVSPGLHLAGGSCDFPTDVLAALKLSAPLGVQLVDGRGHLSGLATTANVDSLNGIAFDTVGRFGRRLLVTGSSHGKTVVDAVSCDGHMGIVTQTAPPLEGGLAIAPTGFGHYGGDLVAPDELSGKILAIAPDGSVSVIADSGLPTGQDIGVESAAFIPSGFMAAGGTAYVADRGTANNPHPGTDSILALSAAELAAAGAADGDLLLATEGGARTIDVRCRTTCSVRDIGSGPSAAHVEGHIAFIFRRQ